MDALDWLNDGKNLADDERAEMHATLDEWEREFDSWPDDLKNKPLSEFCGQPTDFSDLMNPFPEKP